MAKVKKDEREKEIKKAKDEAVASKFGQDVASKFKGGVDSPIDEPTKAIDPKI